MSDQARLLELRRGARTARQWLLLLRCGRLWGCLWRLLADSASLGGGWGAVRRLRSIWKVAFPRCFCACEVALCCRVGDHAGSTLGGLATHRQLTGSLRGVLENFGTGSACARLCWAFWRVFVVSWIRAGGSRCLEYCVTACRAAIHRRCKASVRSERARVLFLRLGSGPFLWSSNRPW